MQTHIFKCKSGVKVEPEQSFFVKELESWQVTSGTLQVQETHSKRLSKQ